MLSLNSNHKLKLINRWVEVEEQTSLISRCHNVEQTVDLSLVMRMLMKLSPVMKIRSNLRLKSMTKRMILTGVRSLRFKMRTHQRSHSARGLRTMSKCMKRLRELPRTLHLRTLKLRSPSGSHLSSWRTLESLSSKRSSELSGKSHPDINKKARMITPCVRVPTLELRGHSIKLTLIVVNSNLPRDRKSTKS